MSDNDKGNYVLVVATSGKVFVGKCFSRKEEAYSLKDAVELFGESLYYSVLASDIDYIRNCNANISAKLKVTVIPSYLYHVDAKIYSAITALPLH